MKFDKDKSCFVNDDGSKMKSSESICSWSDKKYIKWLQDGVEASGKQTVDNTWMWDNKIKFQTAWGKR